MRHPALHRRSRGPQGVRRSALQPLTAPGAGPGGLPRDFDPGLPGRGLRGCRCYTPGVTAPCAGRRSRASLRSRDAPGHKKPAAPVPQHGPCRSGSPARLPRTRCAWRRPTKEHRNNAFTNPQHHNLHVAPRRRHAQAPASRQRRPASLLRHERLRELPRARSRDRRGRVPRLRLHPPHPLTHPGRGCRPQRARPPSRRQPIMAA